MTIFALSTGTSKSGIAIIRISKRTKNILLKITKKKYQIQSPLISEIRDFETNEIIDKGLIMVPWT